jgi:hypothetical protein
VYWHWCCRVLTAGGDGTITAYSHWELVALVRWIQSATLLRTEDELLDEAISLLGLMHRGRNIVDTLHSAIAGVRRSRNVWPYQ